MQKDKFDDILSGLRQATTALRYEVKEQENGTYNALTDSQFNCIEEAIKEVIEKVNLVTIRSLNENVEYKVESHDIKRNENFDRHGQYIDLEEARREAKRIAVKWCTGENGLNKHFSEIGELWAGYGADFGVLIKKVKVDAK